MLLRPCATFGPQLSIQTQSPRLHTGDALPRISFDRSREHSLLQLPKICVVKTDKDLLAPPPVSFYGSSEDFEKSPHFGAVVADPGHHDLLAEVLVAQSDGQSKWL